VATGSAGRGANQLPPGRHGLSRSYVARNQRARILVAVAEVVTVGGGYSRMSVEDIVRKAGVSRRTFYEQFENKDEAFLAAFDDGARLLLASVRVAVESERTFAGRLIAGFGTFLEVLAASPTFAQLCIVEVLAAGPEAIERRTRVMSEFAKLIDENAALLPERPRLPAMTSEAIVGGVYEAVFRRVTAGEPQRLPELLPDVIELALMPYLGERKAVGLADALRGRQDDPVATVVAELADTPVLAVPAAVVAAEHAEPMVDAATATVIPPTAPAA
jgi:AcrR family transcriptional regulator